MSELVVPGDAVKVSGWVGKGSAFEGAVLEMKLPTGRWLVRLGDNSVYSVSPENVSLAKPRGERQQ